ncbi:MAG: hypothetical protein ACJ790_08900 [Myxococcaceae bacterium]
MKGFGLCALAICSLFACKPKDDSPIAGLHSAAAPVFLLGKKDEKRALTVGSKLKPSDRIRASGPAVLEYFGGATKFLDDGDELEVGEAKEASLVSATIAEKKFKDWALEDLPARTKLMAARYADASFTPVNLRSDEPSNAEYLKAFFAPSGMDSFLGGGGDPGEGPRKDLPPPPFRAKVPHVHADDLGPGGVGLKVTKGFISAETDDFATAILVKGSTYLIGRTVRLVLPSGARGVLLDPNGRELELEGPVDVKLK